ncbi:MAG: hypothetical protein ACYS47_10145, partial [Planctomycetota bacterium]
MSSPSHREHPFLCTGAVLILLAALAAGCASTPDFETDPRLDTLRSPETKPLPYRVAVAPFRMGFDPSVENRKASRRYALTPELGLLRDTAVPDLSRLNLFEVLDQVGDADSEDDPLKLAWEKKYDLLVEVFLTKWEAAWR